MKKRRHHYVWRHYLRSWAKNDLIWCLREGKLFNTNLMNIGQKKDFYKLKELTDKDIDFLEKAIVNNSPEHLKKNNQEWIESFNKAFEIKNELEKRNISHAEIDKELDEAVFNLEEDLHGKIESEAIKYIEDILKENIDFYDTDDGCMNFTHYLCVQYMRTQKRKHEVLSSLGSVSFIDTEKIWNILSHLLSTNIAWSLYADRKYFKMILLKNSTENNFITGDQPVINTYAIGLRPDEAPDKLEFYYPLSPKLAILIKEKSSDNESKCVQLTSDEVDKYNQYIVGQSHSQIYGASDSDLKKYNK